MPPGYWIPHSRCEIYRQLPASCAGDVCRALFDKCKTETDAQNDECKQFPVAFVHPCNWQATPALLGVSLYQVPTSALDVDLPYACAPGILGSSDAEDQRSGFCAGLCPAGQRCPEAATTEPRPCTEGNFCPAGTSVPIGLGSPGPGHAPSIRCSVGHCTRTVAPVCVRHSGVRKLGTVPRV